MMRVLPCACGAQPCGSRNLKTQPDWREGDWAWNYKGGA
jgi:hypothetical protein